MQLTNFQTLLLLLRVAVCATDDTSALLLAAAPVVTSTANWGIKNKIAPEVIGSTSVPAYETTWSCPLNSTWSTLSQYAGCRTTASIQAPMYTGCTNISVLLGPFDSNTCTGTGAQISCVTGWINYGHNRTLTNYECWPTWTQGNWKADRIESTGLPLATIIAISVVVPIVAIASVVAGLWWWRRRRRYHQDEIPTLEGRRSSMTSTSTRAPHSVLVAKNIELSQAPDSCEMEEQRRASELSNTIFTRNSTVGPLDQLEEESGIASSRSSYVTTDSRPAMYEMQAHELGADTGERSVGDNQRNILQKMLQRFRW